MPINNQFVESLRDQGIEVYDVRNQFPTNGVYPWRGSTWSYACVHYTGVWRERGTYQQELTSWLGHARFHVNTRGWPGIAYNIGISPSGRVFLMKDIGRWGYHAFNVNEIAMAVSCDTTFGQTPTPQMMRSLQAVLHTLEEVLPNLRSRNVYTHNQFGWYDARNATTLCAGVDIGKAIEKHRAGQPFAKVDKLIPNTPMKKDHAYVELTDKWVVGNTFKMWTSVPGNVLVFGYPLTGMTGNDKDGYTQYFERAVFHHTPEGMKYPDQFDVHLQLIGREVADVRYGRKHPAFLKVPEVMNTDLTRWFPETGHTISNGFKGYWENYGGLRIFGFPISEEFEEDGKVVQYFERARFEWAPGTDPKRYDVVLGRVGAEVMKLREIE